MHPVAADQRGRGGQVAVYPFHTVIDRSDAARDHFCIDFGIFRPRNLASYRVV
jgi:hypothetical protein